MYLHSIPDHHFGLAISAKPESKEYPLISALQGIIAGLEEVLTHLIEYYNPVLDRNIYLCFTNPFLTSAVRLGPFNLKDDPMEDILDTFLAFISNVLQSHQNIEMNQPSKLYVKVLSEDHMKV